MNQDFKNSSIKTNNENPKLKTFAIFKLIMAIIYLIPAFFIFGFGMAINILTLIIGNSDLKFIDTSNYISGMAYVSFFTILPAIFIFVFFIMTLVFTIKLFKNKYNKNIDLFTSILFILINIILIIASIKSYFYIFGIILSVFSIVFIVVFILTTLSITKNSKN